MPARLTKLFPNLHILPKITLITALAVSVMLLAFFLYYLPYVENSILEERRANVRNAVEIAHSIVAHFHNSAMHGMLDKQDAQSFAIETIKDIRYPSQGYVWIHDDTPQMVMHPTDPALDGRNLDGYTDKTGYPMFETMVRLTESEGAGYVSYMWPRPNEDKPVSKLSYVKKFEPWGWILGSGIYMDDVEKDIQDLVYISIVSAAFLAALLMLLAGGLGLNITRRLAQVREGLHDIASGRGYIDLTRRIAVKSDDEIDQLAGMFNRLIEQINGLRVFRLDMDRENRLDAVYSLIADVFSNDIGLEDFRIYERDEDNDDIHIVLERGEQPEGNHVRDVINLLRGSYHGIHDHNNEDRNVIPSFVSNSERHECIFIPLSTGGIAFGVVQFLIDKNAPEARRKLIYQRIDRAKQYIREAVPVLETRRLMKRIEQLALSDPLTGLHNRRFLEECKQRLCAGAERRNKVLGLLMCDLDDFKRINDEYGHDCGDKALIEVADRIVHSVRKMDLVIRMGGEEFLVVLKDVESGMPLAIAEKIRQRISQDRFELPGTPELNLTVSIGVAEYPVDSSRFEQVIKYADLAAYHAKSSGKNRCVRYDRNVTGQEADGPD